MRQPRFELEKTIISASVEAHALLEGGFSAREVLAEVLDFNKISINLERLEADEEGRAKLEEWLGAISAKSLEVQMVDLQR